MEIGNNKIETIDGEMLWTPKGFDIEPEGKIETVTISKEFIPSDADISNKIDELLGKPTLIEELTNLVIKDEQERYIRELLIRNKELQAEVEEANTNASWWKSRYEGANRMLKSTNICYGLTGVEAKMYKHTVAAINQHRLNTANEYIESRKERMIPEHYDDLKYILNECDLESSW